MQSDLFVRVKRKPLKIINQRHAYDYQETGFGWEKYDKNPVLKDDHGGSMFDPFVRRFENSYIMCVSNRHCKSIEMYRSQDGIEWIKSGVALKGLSDSKWEKDVNRACFLHHNNYWYLWYTGQCEGKSCIGFAKSLDGINFERYDQNPVIVPELEYEKESVMNPCVIYDATENIFKMWYAAGENYEPDVIAYAESADGINWKKNNTPVMTSDKRIRYQKAKVGACDVVCLADGRYCMAYIAYQNINVARICLAYSNTGVSDWKYSKHNPIISPSKGKWDGHAVYKPSLIFDEETQDIKLWYNGRTNHCEQIGLAIGKIIDE